MGMEFVGVLEGEDWLLRFNESYEGEAYTFGRIGDYNVVIAYPLDRFMV